ncbi:hypothetical protein CH17P1_00002 [Hungatella phage CH17P1]|nr:hypothetical protein CH17P1_00002 [Hungatella phage CH17P1]
MSKYTTEVRFICEEAAGLVSSVGYLGVNDVINTALPKVFNFDFPIFDEAYRPILEKKILKHYYTREIGLETVGLWKLFLDTKLNEIMPYYNQLYKSELISFNPMYDVDLTRDHQLKRLEDIKETGTQESDTNRNGTLDTTANKTGTTHDTSLTTDHGTANQDISNQKTAHGTNGDTTDVTTTVSHIDKFSDTPQGALDGLKNDTYMSEARIVDDTNASKTIVSGSDDINENNTGNTTTETDATSDTTSDGRTSQNETVNTTNTDKENRVATQNTNKNLNSIDDYIEHVTGKTSGVSYSKLLNEFRETFLNIDMLIINDLSDLFMNLW